MNRSATIGIAVVVWLSSCMGFPVLAAKEPAPAAQPSVTGQAATPEAPAPMTDIHDIQPPVPVGVDAPWLLPVLLALAAVAILAVLWWWWKKHHGRQTIETLVPELPPEMTAMRSLDEIADVRQLDGKTFYFRLSAILRQYVYGRFSVGAPEMTTEEFLPCIDRLPIDRELGCQFKGVSRAMDPVKFGGAMTTEKQMEADLLFARGFVRQTTPATGSENRIDASKTPVSLDQVET